MTSDNRMWTHKDGYAVFEYSGETLIKLEDHERIVAALQKEIGERAWRELVLRIKD